MEKKKVLEMCEPCNIVNDKWKDALVMMYNVQENLCIYFLWTRFCYIAFIWFLYLDFNETFMSSCMSDSR
jgi:hypothetical protein